MIFRDFSLSHESLNHWFSITFQRPPPCPYVKERLYLYQDTIGRGFDGYGRIERMGSLGKQGKDCGGWGKRLEAFQVSESLFDTSWRNVSTNSLSPFSPLTFGFVSVNFIRRIFG